MKNEEWKIVVGVEPKNEEWKIAVGVESENKHSRHTGN